MNEIPGQVFAHVLTIAAEKGVRAIADRLWPGFRSTRDTVDQIIVMTSPQNSERVSYKTECRGIFPKGFESDIWILLVPLDTPTWHPNPAIKNSNGTWQGTAYLGRSENEDSNAEFVIGVASAPTSATKVFQAYLRHAEQSRQWRGLKDLPPEVVVHRAVLVVRR